MPGVFQDNDVRAMMGIILVGTIGYLILLYKLKGGIGEGTKWYAPLLLPQMGYLLFGIAVFLGLSYTWGPQKTKSAFTGGNMTDCFGCVGGGWGGDDEDEQNKPPVTPTPSHVVRGGGVLDSVSNIN